MAAAKMTQSQMIKELAASTEVSNKVAKALVTAYAELAVKETKKNGVCVLPGIGRLVRVDRKAALKAIQTLDALSHALAESDVRWPKKLKRK